MSAIYDVFLGGSCGWTSWRQEKIIPHLKASGITYFNPQKTQWSLDLIQIEEAAKNTSRLLLFVIDPQTANNVGLLEIAYLAAKNYPLIVVLPSRGEFLEISCCPEDSRDRGRAYDTVHALLRAEGIQICSSVEEARDVIEEIVIGQLFISEALRSDRCRWPYLRLKTRRLANACSAPLKTSLNRLFSLSSTSSPSSFSSTLPPASSPSEPSDIGLRVWPGLQPRPEMNRSISAESDGGRTVAGPWSGSSWPLLLVQAAFAVLSYLVHPLLGGAFLLLLLASRASPTRLHVRLKRDENNNPNQQQRRRQQRRNQREEMEPLHFDVYLESSGEGGEKDWIQERAVPVLRKAQLSYFDPRLCSSAPNSADPLKVAAASGQVLFSVASPYSTFSGIIQLAYYIGKGWRILACLPSDLETESRRGRGWDGLVPPGSPDAHGIHRSLAYLADIAARERCTILYDLSQALKKCVRDAQDMRSSSSASSSSRILAPLHSSSGTN